MGIAIIYLQYGTLLFTDLTVFSAATTLPAWITITAIIFILAGMFFKLSLVPCHLWVADLFEGAPLPTAALMATLSKLAVFVVLWRMFSIGQWQHFSAVTDVIAFVAIVTILADRSPPMLLEGVEGLGHRADTADRALMQSSVGFFADESDVIVHGHGHEITVDALILVLQLGIVLLLVSLM